ncbi:MAG: MFS transporter [Lachnospiraceae bacterium]|nr:MFS transporter [Lachnospiraceae bacterium]
MMNNSKNHPENGSPQKVLHKITEPGNRILLLFTLEGMLITLVNNLVGNNNNLFATRLGANDLQLSLLTTIPQLVGLMVLIPGGILTDRMKNKRNMVMVSLSILAMFYGLIGCVPMLPANRFTAFLILFAASVGPMTIYNVSWQAYFSDMVNTKEQNHIITYRTALTFVIGIIVPLVSGSLLAAANTNDGKIRLHQIYFWIGAALLLIQIIVLNQIKGSSNTSSAGLRTGQLKGVFSELLHNKKFLSFVGVAIFFYATWHVDWTLYFIGQVNYLKLNEAWLGYVNIGNAVVQFITIGFWSRLNNKYGVRFGIIFGNLGLALCPICMIVATSLPLLQGQVVFLIMNTLANITLAAINLNILQCLLQVVPGNNKTLYISLYTVLVTLSNAFMPLIGVVVYTKLGADLKGLQITFWTIFVLRMISTGLWFLRWWKLRNRE